MWFSLVNTLLNLFHSTFRDGPFITFQLHIRYLLALAITMFAYNIILNTRARVSSDFFTCKIQRVSLRVVLVIVVFAVVDTVFVEATQ